jgi:hypothetical protein
VQSSLSIVGFGDGFIEFDEDIPLGDTSMEFSAIDSSPAGEMYSSKMLEDQSLSSSTFNVEDASGFFVGQKILIDGVSKIGTIESISGNSITVEDEFFPKVIDNMFFAGTYQLEKDMSTARTNIQAAAQDLHQYIFGGTE